MATVDNSPGADTFPTTLEPYLGAVLLEGFFYGVYTILFSICAYVLIRRWRKIHWILPLLAVAMYSLATADMAYTLWLLFDKLLNLDLSYQDLRLKFWLYVTNNVLADTLLLYRCYVVWGYDKRVIAIPTMLLLSTTVCGFVIEGSTSTTLFTNSWIYPLSTMILNVFLTILTASRIWSISRKTRRVLDPSLAQRYNLTLSILVESGFIYSLYMVLDLAFRKNPSGSVVLDASLIQVVGIMPTLIIAQIGVGRAVHDLEANFRTMNVESGLGSTIVSSKMEIRSAATVSALGGGSIIAHVDTEKHMCDVSSTSPVQPTQNSKKEVNGYPHHDDGVASSREASNHARPRYNPTSYFQAEVPCDGEVVDLHRDVEKGELDDRYHEEARFTTNGSVLDYVLREEVDGDSRTVLPSVRLKNPQSI